MLVDQINNKNDSWAIRWYASTFVKNMYTLYPSKSFVQNIGTDGSGTHGSGKKNIFNDKDLRKTYSSIKSKKLNCLKTMRLRSVLKIILSKILTFFKKNIQENI